MMAGPGDERAAGVGDRGRLRASHADREQVIGTLKAAFVQGMLDKNEFDQRVSETFAARTYADLVPLIADLPGGPTVAQWRTSAHARSGLTMKRAVTWSACMVIATVMAAVIGWVLGAGPVFVVSSFAFVMATVAAGTMIVEAWDKNKQSRAQLPEGPSPGAGGQASRRLPSAGTGRQLPPASHGHRHVAESARSRRPHKRQAFVEAARGAS
jgi:hypothetical protein